MKKCAGSACRLMLGILVLLLVCTTASFAASPSADAQVMMDGKYITFNQDSLPKNVNGRIMVPYRAIFEYLGLEVGYDEATGEISGTTDDFVLVMKNQNPVITMTYADGRVEKRTMDVAPYISGGRTFVPTRFVSEMLGYSVGWDSQNRTVIIIDGAGLAADAEKDFSILNKLQEMGSDAKTAYEFKGTMDMNAEAAGSAVNMTGTFSGVVENGNEDMKLHMEMKADEETETVDADVKFDMTSGDMYMKAPGVTEDNQWLRISLSGLLGDQWTQLQKLMVNGGQDQSISAVLEQMIAGASEDYAIETYDEMKAVYEGLKGMFGDQNFVKKNNAYTASFAQQLDGADVKGSMNIQLDRNGKVSGYSMDLKIGAEGVEMTMKLSAAADSADVSLGMTAPDVTADMKISISMTETTKHADIKIPSGDSVVDLNELLGDLFGGLAA